MGSTVWKERKANRLEEEEVDTKAKNCIVVRGASRFSSSHEIHKLRTLPELYHR